MHDVLAHETRRRILQLLRDGELTAGDLAAALDRPRPGVSHHATVLVQGGVLEYRTEGAFRWYRLNVPRALEAWDSWLRASGLGVDREVAA